jgi:hypothetical protein
MSCPFLLCPLTLDRRSSSALDSIARLEAAADKWDYIQPLDASKVQERAEKAGGRPGFWGTLYTHDKWTQAEVMLNKRSNVHEDGTTDTREREKDTCESMDDYYKRMKPRSVRTPFQDLFAPFEGDPINLDLDGDGDLGARGGALREDVKCLYQRNSKRELFDTLDRKRLIEVHSHSTWY